jgi:peptidoglycan/xylan/chitin deacetylase (PgdA/CDA1 family)
MFTQGDRFGNEDADFGARLLDCHRVCFNRQAITHQRYMVGPRQNMERAFLSGRADVAFMRKYPVLLPTLLRLKHANKPITRYLYRPLGKVPLAPRIAASLAVWIAQAALQTRWRDSRVLARAFYAARSLAYWSAVQRSGGFPAERRALVLCYHVLEGAKDDPVLAPYGVSPETFASHVDSLERRGFAFITPGHLLDLVERGVPVPRRSVLLTFDDCYEPLLEVARDILAPRGIKALGFAVTRRQSNDWDRAAGAKEHRLLDDAGLSALSAMGCEIGSHTRTHQALPDLDDDELDAETRGAFEDFAGKGLPTPRFFSYPYGRHDERCAAKVEAAGYRAALLVNALGNERYARNGVPATKIPRLEIAAADSPRRFALKTRWPWLAPHL